MVGTSRRSASSQSCTLTARGKYHFLAGVAIPACHLQVPLVGGTNLVPRSVGWLRAKDLSFFDMEEPESDRIPYFQEARDHYARAHGFNDYAAVKAMRQELGLPEKRLSGWFRLFLHWTLRRS